MRAALAVLLLVACGDAPESESPRAVETGCAAGEVTIEGGCSRPGVPSDSCAPGFEPDADGCRPVLPAAPCGPGLIATPGMTACAPVAPCGRGTWGSIATDGLTEFVDGAYPGSDSDGSATKPWTSIQAAVDAAAPGAVVAIAAGRYYGDVLISGKQVHLWGRCPELVEVAGTGQSLCAIGVLSGAHQSELHDLAVTGAACGFGVSGSQGVVAERLWVHDTDTEAMVMDDNLGASELTMRGSLFENNRRAGIYVEASPLTLVASLVRDTHPDPAGAWGRCISAIVDLQSGARASLHVEGSLLERCLETGMIVGGSDLSMDGSVVRGTLPQPTSGLFGRAVALQDLAGQPSRGTIRRSLIESSYDVGILVGGSEGLIETTIIRSTVSEQATGRGGLAITAQQDPVTGARSLLTLKRSLLSDSREGGLVVFGADATIEDVVVRRTTPQPSGLYGDGFGVATFDDRPTTATMTRSRIESSARAGVSSFGAHVELSSTHIDCAAFALDAEPVDGVSGVIVDGGYNQCGCAGVTNLCAVESAKLEPPQPIE